MRIYSILRAGNIFSITYAYLLSRTARMHKIGFHYLFFILIWCFGFGILESREADMRNVSENTNSRVALYSMISLAVCISVSALQLWHLKRFFQKKKLI